MLLPVRPGGQELSGEPAEGNRRIGDAGRDGGKLPVDRALLRLKLRVFFQNGGAARAAVGAGHQAGLRGVEKQVPKLLFLRFSQSGILLRKQAVQLLSGKRHGIRLILHAEHPHQKALRGVDPVPAHQPGRRAPEGGAARRGFCRAVFRDGRRVQKQARSIVQNELIHGGFGGRAGKLADLLFHRPVLILPHRPFCEKIPVFIKGLRGIRHLPVRISEGQPQRSQADEMGKRRRRVLISGNVTAEISRIASRSLHGKRRFRIRQGRLQLCGSGSPGLFHGRSADVQHAAHIIQILFAVLQAFYGDFLIFLKQAAQEGFRVAAFIIPDGIISAEGDGKPGPQIQRANALHVLDHGGLSGKLRRLLLRISQILHIAERVPGISVPVKSADVVQNRPLGRDQSELFFPQPVCLPVFLERSGQAQKLVQRDIPHLIQQDGSTSHPGHHAEQRRGISGLGIPQRQVYVRFKKGDEGGAVKILDVHPKQSGQGLQLPVHAVILRHHYGKESLLIDVAGPSVRPDAFGTGHLQAQRAFCRVGFRGVQLAQVGQRHRLSGICCLRGSG